LVPFLGFGTARRIQNTSNAGRIPTRNTQRGFCPAIR
jgi:hypothetical protein